MASSRSIRLYELTLEFFKDKEKAKEYVAKIEQVVDEKFKTKEDTLATKIDLNAAIGDIKVLIAESKIEIIKWYLATSVAIAGICFAINKLL